MHINDLYRRSQLGLTPRPVNNNRRNKTDFRVYVWQAAFIAMACWAFVATVLLAYFIWATA
jgi:hypothetical protein